MTPQQALQAINAALASEFCFLNETTRRRIVEALQVLMAATTPTITKPKEDADVEQPKE